MNVFRTLPSSQHSNSNNKIMTEYHIQGDRREPDVFDMSRTSRARGGREASHLRLTLLLDAISIEMVQ